MKPILFCRRTHAQLGAFAIRMYPANAAGWVALIAGVLVIVGISGAVALYGGIEWADPKSVFAGGFLIGVPIFIAAAYPFSVPENETNDLDQPDA